MKITNLLFCLFFFILISNCFCFLKQFPSNLKKVDYSTIQIRDGSIKGVIYDNARAYLGVPFGSAGRWEKPTNPKPWSNTLDVTEFAPNCPQNCELPDFTCPLNGYSEDCLSLDVYTPRDISSSSEPKKTMLFYYGGDYIQGGDSTPLYSGFQLVNQTDVVLVVINYRLGALGFLHTSDLGGNYGFFDQNLALQWIQENIKYFGGNPNQVTIFGQSAGSMSVTSQLTSPLSNGLYHSAIIESNPVSIAWSTEHNAFKMADKFAAALNCTASNSQCLRSASIDDVLAAQLKGVRVDPNGVLQVFVPWLPWLDPNVFPSQPLDAFKAGNWSGVPLIIGTVENEGVMFVDSGFPFAVNHFEYVTIMETVFGKYASTVLNMYPCKIGTSDCRSAMSKLATDYMFACPSRQLLRSAAKKNNGQTYMYRFNHVIQENVWGAAYSECSPDKNVVCHGSELPFVFGSMENAPSPYKWGPGEAQLSKAMSNYWGNFANTHNPNSPFKTGNVNWSVYSESTSQNIVFTVKSGISIQSNYLNETCNYFDSIGYSHGTFYN